MGQSIRIDDLVDGQRFSAFNLNLLFWSFLAMFADGYDISVMGFAVPTLSKIWHVDTGRQGWVLTASLIGILGGSPLLGYIGDRFGRKTAVLIGSVIYGATTLAVIWLHGFWVSIALRFCTGIGIGGLMPNTIALNSELSPKHLRAMLIVLMFTGITLGSSAPGLLSAWTLPVYGWSVLFLVGGAVPLLVAACLYFTLPESVKFLARRPERRAELLNTARRMRNDLVLDEDVQFDSTTTGPEKGGIGTGEIFGPGFRAITPLLWVCFLTTLMANYFLNSWTPQLFNSAGLSPKQAALASSWYHVGGTASGLVVSVLLDRFGFVVIVALFVCAAPAIAAIGAGSLSYATLAPLAAIAGFSVLGAQFGNNAAAGLLYPTQFRSKAVGWALGIGRFGAMVGPLVGGYLIKMHLPMRTLFAVASVPMWFGLIAALILLRLCFVRFGRLQLSDVPLRR